MEEYFISMAVTTILLAVKNPAKKKALKAAMLKIRNKINEAYATDEDFQ